MPAEVIARTYARRSDVGASRPRGRRGGHRSGYHYKAKKSMVYRQNFNNICHSFKRWTGNVQSSSVGSNITIDNSYTAFSQYVVNTNSNTQNTCVLSFQLNQLPNYSEFTSLYDFYRINYVQLRIESVGNTTSEANQTGYLRVPSIVYAFDYDGTNTTSVPDIQAIYEYANARRKTFSADRTAITIGSRPRIPMIANDGTQSINTFINLPGKYRRPWVDASNPLLRHFSVILGFDTAGVGTTVSQYAFNLTAKFYLTFKNPR